LQIDGDRASGVPFPGMPTSIVRIVILPALLAGVIGCGGEPDQKARRGIHAAGFAFSVDDFLRAAREGRADVIRNFLDAGMNPGAGDERGMTALSSAAAGGHGHVVSLLLSRGAQSSVSSGDGMTPLRAAAESGDEEAVRALLAAGADARMRDAGGVTPLAAAARAGHSSAVALLAGEDPDSLDGALRLAATGGHTAVISVLIDRGADPLAAGEKGITALMAAAGAGQVEAVRLLRQRGACVTALDDALKSAADHADENGHAAVADSLRLSDRSADPVDPADALVRITAFQWSGGAPSSLSELAAQMEFAEFRCRPLNVRVEEVAESEDSALVRTAGDAGDVMTVRQGEEIPGTGMTVERMRRRAVASKHESGRRIVVSELLLGESSTGRQHLAVHGLPAVAAEGIALVRIAGSSDLIEVRRGDEFRAGTLAVRVTELRPLRIVLRQSDGGESVVIERRPAP
jgi:ankyrin repeat protein